MDEPTRLTVSVPPEIAEQLDEIKQSTYYKASQAEMIRDLLALGVKAFKEKEA